MDAGFSLLIAVIWLSWQYRWIRNIAIVAAIVIFPIVGPTIAIITAVLGPFYGILRFW